MNDKAVPQPSPDFLSRHAVGVQRLAVDLGVPETEVFAALEFKPGYTPECLRPDDVENFASLSEQKRAHMRTCEFCRELEQAMNAVPTEAEVRRTIDLTKARPRCPACGQYQQHDGSLATFFGKLGISDETVANLGTQMQNVDIDEYLNTARDYLKDAGGKAKNFTKENPAKVAAGVAVLAVGAGLLISALNRD
jgi:hypothetical protein